MRGTPRRRYRASPSRLGWSAAPVPARPPDCPTGGRLRACPRNCRITLTGIEMQNGRKWRVGVCLWLAITEAGAHGAGIGAGCAIELRHRPGKTRFGHVAEGASLIAI